MFFYMLNSSPFVRFFKQKISNSRTKKTYQKKKVNEKGVTTLQTNKSFSVILHNSIQTCRRISFGLFSKRNMQSASMTLEAALVLPLFLFAVLNLMSFIEIYRLQSNWNMTLHQSAKELAVIGGVADKAGEEECIDLLYPYKVEPFVSMVGFSEFWMYSRMRTRAWTGYDVETVYEEEEDMVYITEHGEVYHLTKSCSYLKLSIRAVDIDFVEGLRNADGACFYACEQCGKQCTNTVFITSYGNRYHATLQCSSLKRKIREIPLSDVGNRNVCKKCG